MNIREKRKFLESLIRPEIPCPTISDRVRAQYFNEGIREEMAKLLKVEYMETEPRGKIWYKDLMSKMDQEAGVESKPPLGLMPQHLHNEQRLIAITQAVGRYIGAGKSIPDEWLEEMLDLQRWVQFHRDNHLLETNLPTA